MKIGSMIAIYFVIWWTVLFAVLPFGVRNSHEAGEQVKIGNDAGAPTVLLEPGDWNHFSRHSLEL